MRKSLSCIKTARFSSFVHETNKTNEWFIQTITRVIQIIMNTHTCSKRIISNTKTNTNLALVYKNVVTETPCDYKHNSTRVPTVLYFILFHGHLNTVHVFFSYFSFRKAYKTYRWCEEEGRTRAFSTEIGELCYGYDSAKTAPPARSGDRGSTRKMRGHSLNRLHKYLFIIFKQELINKQWPSLFTPRLSKHRLRCVRTILNYNRCDHSIVDYV